MNKIFQHLLRPSLMTFLFQEEIKEALEELCNLLPASLKTEVCSSILHQHCFPSIPSRFPDTLHLAPPSYVLPTLSSHFYPHILSILLPLLPAPFLHLLSPPPSSILTHPIFPPSFPILQRFPIFLYAHPLTFHLFFLFNTYLLSLSF